jgi:hypothetical protein
MAKRLVAANSRRLAALALLGGLCACATTSAEPRPEAQPAGWRIVERIGEARHAPPGAAAWLAATVGETLADGSEVSTGRGGRLIVDAPGRHISVGPDSRFVLPDRDRNDRLEQRAGWLRYRIADAEARPFRIHTRSLELELLAGVVDVHVNHLATEVTVKEGQVRVATPDGLRQSQMIAGQSAHAGGSDVMQLAVRRAPGAALQPVEPVIVPALHARSTPTDTPRTSTPAISPPAWPTVFSPAHMPTGWPGDRAQRHGPPATRPEAATREARSDAAPQPVASPSGRLRAADDEPGPEIPASARREVVPAVAPDPAMQPGQRRNGESEAAAIRRAKFERLTAGMLDQVQPPRHSPVRW